MRDKNRFEIHHFFLVFALLWGTVQVFIMPPLQVPDEPGHFTRAWGVSDFQFKCQRSLVRVPKNIASFLHDFDRINIDNGHTTVKKLNQYLEAKVDSDLFERGTNFCAYNPLGYAPQALGITLAKLFDLSVLWVFYSGRFCNLIVSIILIYLAIKYVPFGKPIFAFVGLLPMTIHQIGSLSCDALAISALLFFTSQVIYFSQKKAIDKIGLTYLIILSLLSIQIKHGYIAFLLLLLILRREQFDSNLTYISFALSILASNLLLFFGLSQLSNMEDLIKIIPQIRPIEQINFIITNPIHYLFIFFHSLWVRAIGLTASTIGVLGWLNIKLPNFLYLLVFAALIFILVTNNENINQSLFMRGILLIIAIITVFIIFTLQYIFWTAPHEPLIEGNQGRYFLPILPLIMLCFYFNRMEIFTRYFENHFNLKWIILSIIFLVISSGSIIRIFSFYNLYYFS